VIASWRGVFCFYPGEMIQLLGSVTPKTEQDIVVCTPTYGFATRVLSGAKPSSDWHRLDDRWIMIASQTSATAIADLKKGGASFAFFTSYDFNLGTATLPDGTQTITKMCSGGFERYLPDVLEDVQNTFIYQVFQDHVHIPGMKRIQTATDKSGQIKMVLIQFE
jgi:hypothetical protein